MNNLVKDISILTTIPELTLNKLINLIVDYISHQVVEAIKLHNDIVVIDIGIGVLYINIYSNDKLEFKFVPSSYLQKTIIDTYESKESSLVLNVESLLTEKIINTYKNLL